MTLKNKCGSAERIALYGGSFDPVHQAHVAIALHALEQAKLDRVLFIPASKSPFKAKGANASNEARARMVELATEGLETLQMSRYEMEQGGVSYSLNTAQHFRALYPQAELFWVLGADQFELLGDWRAIEDLARIVQFLVVGRPEYSLEAPAVQGLRYQLLQVPLMENSSSEIRGRIENGESINGLVCPAVEAFIYENRIYSRC